MNADKTIAAGSVRLAQPFTAEDYDLARRTIVAACAATKRARARNAAGRITYVDEPDFPVRLAAARTIAEFVSGKPVAMSITANLTPGESKNADDFLGDVLRDRDAVTALQETLKKLADAAEKARRPIDVTASLAGSEKPNPEKQPLPDRPANDKK